MKFNIIYLTITLGLLSFSCREGGIKPTNCRDGKCAYTFEEGKKLVLDSSGVDAIFVEVQEGNDLVFTYSYTKNDRPNIADDEYSETIRFQVPAGADSFRYEDAELNEMPMYLQAICFCPQEISRPLRGSVSGKKRDDKMWEIEMDVVFDLFDTEEVRSFESTFEEAE